MATNRDLLKEAIADAKAVRETALANAKAALEESFSPQLKSMLSAKLQEMEEEDENLEEDLFEVEDEEGMDENLDLNELLDELNEEDEVESEEEEMESEEEGEPLELEDMTDEDLKQMIEDVIADMVAAGELEAGEGAEGEEAEDMEGEEVEDEEEVDLDELLAEIESMEEDDDMMYEEEDMMEEGFMDKIVKFVTRESGKIKEKIDQMPTAIRGGIKRGELPSGYQPSESEISALVAQIKDDGGLGEYYVSNDKLAYRTAKETKGSAQASTFESLQTELEEAYATIETLRSDLNEVNLLNAKLLYTNKIFKAKNLTENQKLKVLGMFDKAASVKETKLVYETLSEGLKDTRKPIKESLGSASKIMGTPAKKQPILESNDMVARFQKLAGIIKD